MSDQPPTDSGCDAGYAHSDPIEPQIMCDYHHDTEPDERPATWIFIGEAGDFYVCDEHFAMRTEEGRRGWHRVSHQR